jgi:hypothetical protein
MSWELGISIRIQNWQGEQGLIIVVNSVYTNAFLIRLGYTADEKNGVK